MAYFLAKIAISALVIVIASEIAKRSTLLAAVIVSLPLVSILAMTWLYLDTRDLDRVATMASDVGWLVLPSLTLFVVVPAALERGLGFWAALALGALSTAVAYAAVVAIRGVAQ
ncbi:DUF3147 family protein [bacterium]|nr:DUF3147 family protein [bacterium]